MPSICITIHCEKFFRESPLPLISSGPKIGHLRSCKESMCLPCSRATLIVGFLIFLLLGSPAAMSEPDSRNPRLVTRGFLDSPTGVSIVTGDLGWGGLSVVELKVSVGQRVKRGDVVAVLSEYDRRNAAVREAEAVQARERDRRASLLTGSRLAELEIQATKVRAAELSLRLKKLGIDRSTKPREMKQLEVELAAEEVMRERAELAVLRQSLEHDLEVADVDEEHQRWRVEYVKALRDFAFVRAPFDGVVAEVYAHSGAVVSPQRGVARIIDFRQLRVIAEVPEVEMHRVTAGAEVEVTFRGGTMPHRGRIVRVGLFVRRMNRPDSDSRNSSDSPVVQVEISLDRVDSVEPVLGREAKIEFR